jgi:HlyD family secretion protein
VKVDAIPDREYKGHVVEIGSSAAVRQGAGAGIRYFKVKVAIDDADDRLRPGMTSQVSIVTENAPNAVVVPIQSVVERPADGSDDDEDENKPKKKYVFLAAGDKAKQVEVQTGISDATHVDVRAGVKAGDSVITGPFRTLRRLKAGAAITVTKETKKSSKDKEKDKDEDDQ